MLRTWLTESCGLRHPIVGAPMAGVAHGELARAVSLAGGLGMIGIGSTDPVSLIAQTSYVAREGGRFGIGLMVWAIERRPELLEATLAERPSAISLSFGDVAPYLTRTRDAGALVFVQVNTLEDARAAERAGVDAIVVQGNEAGGHTGAVATLPLMQLVLGAVKTPVLVAGGIATPRGVAAALAAGAQGAWIGTALIAANEARTSDAARERIFAATERDTVHTHLFDRVQDLPWPESWPGRALANEFARVWNDRQDELLSDARALGAYRAAKARGDYDLLHIYAGQGVAALERARSAGEIVTGLSEGAEALLRACLPRLLAGE